MRIIVTITGTYEINAEDLEPNYGTTDIAAALEVDRQMFADDPMALDGLDDLTVKLAVA